MTVPDSPSGAASAVGADALASPSDLVRALAGTFIPDADAAPAPGAAPAVGRPAEADTDLLGNREEAVEWLRAAGLLPPDDGLTGSEHNALLRLRDALRDVLAARAAGHAEPDAAARLTRALADGRLVVTVDPAGAVRLVSSARATYSGLVAAIAIAIADSGLAI